MSRKIIRSIVAALVFGGIALLFEMAFYAIIGTIGIPPERPMIIIGRLFSIILIAMPILGFVLGWLGKIPGCRK